MLSDNSGKERTAIFGYVRAYKPFMRMFEYDIYRAAYCGLCKDMGRRYGFLTRFSLSYDLTFLALMDFSVRGAMLDAEPQRCVAHPFRKKPCATCKNDYSYTSAAAIILVYHKLRDDLGDKRGIKKLPALLALPVFSRAHKKAGKAQPELSERIGELMELQSRAEREQTPSVDKACEPTALMMEAVFGGLSEDGERKELLRRFGYLLGRFIYSADALDDLRDDYKKGGYNPLLAAKGMTGRHKEPLPEESFGEFGELMDMTVNLTLGELGDTFDRLGLERFKDILGNIVYLGLKNVYYSVKSGTFDKNKGKGVSAHE